MAKWTLVGLDHRQRFEESLDAEVLAEELNYYRVALGEGFGLRELLDIKRIEAMALIAEMIGDAPEYLVHQICVAEKEGRMNGIIHGLNDIANALD